MALEDFKLNNQHISKGTILKCLYYGVFIGNGPVYYSYYVEYNGKMEEIEFLDSDSPLVEKNDAQVEQSTEQTPTEEKENLNEQNIPENTKDEVQTTDKQQNNKLDYYTIIYLCIGAAVLIALTSMVTIILVNKKNQNKISNEPQKRLKKIVQKVNKFKNGENFHKEAKLEILAGFLWELIIKYYLLICLINNDII